MRRQKACQIYNKINLQFNDITGSDQVGRVKCRGSLEGEQQGALAVSALDNQMTQQSREGSSGRKGARITLKPDLKTWSKSTYNDYQGLTGLAFNLYDHDLQKCYISFLLLFFERVILIVHVFKLLQLFRTHSAICSALRALFLIFYLTYIGGQNRPQDALIFL